jgi:2'-5' RNA ligase
VSETIQIEKSYRRVWDAFCLSKLTLDGRHDTPRWQAHGGVYAACVVRVDAQALQPILTELRAALVGLDGVRLHPDPFLHIMVQELGYVVPHARDPGQMTIERLEEFAQSSVEPVANTRSFSVDLGGVNAFVDAIFLESHRAGELVRLHERLFELSAIPRAPIHSFLPQCTIAQFVGGTPTEPVREALLPFRETKLGDIEVHEVEIVTFDTNQTYPHLESYAVIPLKS